jgi:hypothetical protein
MFDMFIYSLPILYPASIYLLPFKYAKKIDFMIDIIKVIANGLENARDTKGGISSKYGGF